MEKEDWIVHVKKFNIKGYLRSSYSNAASQLAFLISNKSLSKAIARFFLLKLFVSNAFQLKCFDCRLGSRDAIVRAKLQSKFTTKNWAKNIVLVKKAKAELSTPVSRVI